MKHPDKESNILQSIVGKTIKSVGYDGTYSAPIYLFFTDNTAIVIDAQGDDMTHTTIEVEEVLDEGNIK